jgi:hypothetical protein
MDNVIDQRMRVPLAVPVGVQKGVRILYADRSQGMTKRRLLDETYRVMREVYDEECITMSMDEPSPKRRPRPDNAGCTLMNRDTSDGCHHLGGHDLEDFCLTKATLKHNPYKANSLSTTRTNENNNQQSDNQGVTISSDLQYGPIWYISMDT